MNNPLEAVTQAVNSLVTALKLPDESAKANEVLGEMSFPQFSRLLPYRDYNQESGLFMNDTTMGFMLEAIPINGANESIVEALDHMLRTKLPRGIPLCIHLMSSQLVGDRIEYGLREFSWSGEQAERFNAIIRMFSQIANIMLYCLFIFFWILVGLILWVKISWQTFVNGCIYWWCTTLEGMRDLIKSQPVYEIQYYGKTFRMNAAQVLHDKYMIW